MKIYIITGIGLSDAMSGHIPQFVAHCICGNDLLKMSKQQLDYLMVSGERGREREREREIEYHINC